MKGPSAAAEGAGGARLNAAPGRAALTRRGRRPVAVPAHVSQRGCAGLPPPARPTTPGPRAGTRGPGRGRRGRRAGGHMERAGGRERAAAGSHCAEVRGRSWP